MDVVSREARACPIRLCMTSSHERSVTTTLSLYWMNLNCTFPEVTVKFETIHLCSRHPISRYNCVINYYRALCVDESLPRNVSL